MKVGREFGSIGFQFRIEAVCPAHERKRCGLSTAEQECGCRQFTPIALRWMFKKLLTPFPPIYGAPHASKKRVKSAPA
jgi:hypothetical protein